MCCYGTNTSLEDYKSERILGDAEAMLTIDSLDLVEGTYKLDVAVHKLDGYPYDYHRLLYTFRVKSRTKDVGIYRPPHTWSFSPSGGRSPTSTEKEQGVYHAKDNRGNQLGQTAQVASQGEKILLDNGKHRLGEQAEESRARRGCTGCSGGWRTLFAGDNLHPGPAGIIQAFGSDERKPKRNGCKPERCPYKQNTRQPAAFSNGQHALHGQPGALGHLFDRTLRLQHVLRDRREHLRFWRRRSTISAIPTTPLLVVTAPSSWSSIMRAASGGTTSTTRILRSPAGTGRANVSKHGLRRRATAVTSDPSSDEQAVSATRRAREHTIGLTP